MITQITAAMCSLSDDIYDYQCVTQGTVNVATIKDKDGMQLVHVRETLLLLNH